jgi:hypothetical protein
MTEHSMVQEVFQPIHGLMCWGVNWERYLNLSMSFGQPRLVVHERYDSESPIHTRRKVVVRGEWWLWIFAAYWKLSLRDVEPITSSSSNKRIQRALAFLDGQKLENIEVKASTGATRFIFDLGGVLDVHRFEPNADSNLWTLYTPTGYALSVLGTGAIDYGLSES